MMLAKLIGQMTQDSGPAGSIAGHAAGAKLRSEAQVSGSWWWLLLAGSLPHLPRPLCRRADGSYIWTVLVSEA